MSQYERLTLIEIKPILSAMALGPDDLDIYVGEVKVTVGLSSTRIRTYTKGTRCVHCGKEGHYFAVERDKRGNTSRWHLNLYHLAAVTLTEVMMTSDHIVAKILGGSLHDLSNRQPMCQPCNSLKGKYATVQEGEVMRKEHMIIPREKKLLKIKEDMALCMAKVESGDTTKPWLEHIEKHNSAIRKLEGSLNKLRS